MLGGVTSNEILAFEKNARDWISTHLPANMHTHGAGFDLLLGKLAEQNTRSMISGMGMALVLVALLMIYSLRSVKYGLLSMLPNLFPALVSLGIWAMIDGNIGIAVSFVACMTLGIVIDNTVHFLSKYMRIKREGNLDAIEATRSAFKTVGVALFATTLVIAGNFGVMAMSHYYPNSSMGLLTAITVGVALVINFVFFVPLLLFIDAGEKKQAARRVVVVRPTTVTE
jgi:predicted RND superfamily exporter protein